MTQFTLALSTPAHLWTTLSGFTLTPERFSRAGEAKCEGVVLDSRLVLRVFAHTPLFCSIGVILVYFLPSPSLCPPAILSMAIIASLLSNFLLSHFASFPPVFSAFSTTVTWLVSTANCQARNRWHTQIQRILERFNERTICKV